MRPFLAQIGIVIIFLTIWAIVQPTGLIRNERTVNSELNVPDKEVTIGCDFSKWNLGISLFELFLMSAGAWYHFVST